MENLWLLCRPCHRQEVQTGLEGCLSGSHADIGPIDVICGASCKCPARTLALQERAPASAASAADCGPSSPGSLARYDRATHSLKTWQLCLDGEWETFSATLPRSGSMRSGTVFPLRPLAHPISATASGSWPTPVAQDDNKSPEAHMAMKGRMKGGPWTYDHQPASHGESDRAADVAHADSRGWREQGDAAEAAGTGAGRSQSGDGGALADAKRGHPSLWDAEIAWAPRTRTGLAGSCGDVPITRRPRLALGEWAHAATTGAGWWATEPDVGRVVDGPAGKVDRRQSGS